jgi:diaminopimelate epimerase
MKFTKMHGIGNDYVYVNGFEETVADAVALAPKVADRHFGVGGDGLILILPSDTADVRMRMFNADGSESEICGNGIRCVAKYAFDHGLTKNNPIKVETGNGVLPITLHLGSDGKVSTATVDMGAPVVEPEKVPVDPKWLRDPKNHTYSIGVAAHTTDAPEGAARGGKPGPRPWLFDMTFVSMGNPHAVVYTDDVKGVDLEKFGPLIEHHKAFPKRINAHFVQVVSPNEVVMRTWERGSGITLACGTGACAVCVAGVLTGKTQRKLRAHLPGGDLQLEWRESDDHVYMTGGATEVFSGQWPG